MPAGKKRRDASLPDAADYGEPPGDRLDSVPGGDRFCRSAGINFRDNGTAAADRMHVKPVRDRSDERGESCQPPRRGWAPLADGNGTTALARTLPLRREGAGSRLRRGGIGRDSVATAPNGSEGI